MSDNLKLSLENSKMQALSRSRGVNTAAFNLSAGRTCSKANICHSWVNSAGKISRGPNCEIICNFAKLESRYPNVRRAHAHNTHWVRTHSAMEFYDNMTMLLKYHGIKIIRINGSGDFISSDYFNSWVKIAIDNPQINFFGYTKHFDYWHSIKLRNLHNLKFVFSLGSLDDDTALNYAANTCTIVSPGDNFTGRIICQDKTNESLSEDYHYIMDGLSFGLNLH